jgi:predicted Zn-dependent peptidase
MEIIFLYNKENMKIVIAGGVKADRVVLKQGTKPCETKTTTKRKV